MYSGLPDIQNRVPFTIDANSCPTATQVSGLWKAANWYLNAYIGRTSDIAGNLVSGLSVIESELTLHSIKEMHDDRIPTYHFSPEMKTILDNYRSEDLIKLGKLEWGF